MAYEEEDTHMSYEEEDIPPSWLVLPSYEEEDTCHMRRRIHAFWPATETCKLVRDTGEVMLGLVSNGDFHWESPKPPEVPVTWCYNTFRSLLILIGLFWHYRSMIPLWLGAINGTLSTPVGCVICELIDWNTNRSLLILIGLFWHYRSMIPLLINWLKQLKAPTLKKKEKKNIETTQGSNGCIFYWTKVLYHNSRTLSRTVENTLYLKRTQFLVTKVRYITLLLVLALL